MAMLADSFLKDLDDLGGSSDEEEEEERDYGGRQVKSEEGGDDDDGEDDDAMGGVEEAKMGEGKVKSEMAMDHDGFMMPKPKVKGEAGLKKEASDSDVDKLLTKIKADTLDKVALLRKTKRYRDIITRIDESLSEGGGGKSLGGGPVEDSPEYQLIVGCNRLVQDIDEEIVNVHRFVVDLYSKKFPELDSLVPGKLDYVRTVQLIGNETDMTKLSLEDVLPPASVMVVTITGSQTSGQPLSSQLLMECLNGCKEVEELFEARTKVLGFVEGRMNAIAPNMSALVGSVIAAQLMGQAGGLTALSRIPACNIQVMGQEKKALHGFASTADMKHAGLVYFCELVQRAPPHLRMKALKVTAAKLALAARADSYGQQNDGQSGRLLRQEIEEKIEKWQEPSKPKIKKALPVPDDAPRKKRGGKRVRKMKDKLAQTELWKQQNKRSFGTIAGEYSDDAMGMDFGMIGAAGLRLPAIKEQKMPIKKQRKMEVVQMSSGATNGMASSLVFTPTQGIELVNPLAMQEKQKKLEEANKKWFSQSSGFASARPR